LFYNYSKGNMYSNPFFRNSKIGRWTIRFKEKDCRKVWIFYLGTSLWILDFSLDKDPELNPNPNLMEFNQDINNPNPDLNGD